MAASSSLVWRIPMLTGLWRGLCQSFTYLSPFSRSLPPLAVEGLLHPSYDCQPACSYESGASPDLALLGDRGLLLFAAPKGRTSHSRKRKRMTSKWLKNIVNYTVCSHCGNARRLHILCGHCLRKTLVETAQLRRQKDPHE